MYEQNQFGQPEENASGTEPLDLKPTSGIGALIGAIIVILLLAFGALYFWGAKLNDVNKNPPPLILGNDTASSELSDASGFPPQQTSDEVVAINSDIQAMNIDQLNAQLANSLTAYESATQ